MTESPLLVLDADGVFLDETPYWQAALVAALRRGGPPLPAPAEQAFVAAALAQGLQRCTKQRGCNSNWDLAIVLVAVLQQGAARRAITERHWSAACAELATAVAALAGPTTAADPLRRFGLDRAHPAAVATAAACAAALQEITARDGWRCLGDLPAMHATLAALRARGFRLGICTGRDREDLFAALQANALQTAFDATAIVDVDRVTAAAASAGPDCRPKPHAFPLLAAAIGVEAAVAQLRGERRPLPTRVIYAGDGRADLETADAARRAGMPVQYAQIVSPASDPDTIAAAGSTAWCLGVFASLHELATHLQAEPR